MKRLGLIAFILALVLCFAMPASAIKLMPYSMPLQDIIRWDKSDEILKLSNPEGESISVVWPSTVDLLNFDGTYWTWDLPDGLEFAFSKTVNVFIASTEGEGATIRGINVVDTVGAALGIHEGIRSLITSAYMTGGWANAIQGTITYSATGSAGGGMAAPICSEMNMQPAGSSGGSYYNYHSYFNFPASTVLLDSTSFNYAFELYEAVGDAVGCFDDFGEFIRIVGLTDTIDHIWYDNTLRIHIGTQDWYIPLSAEQGMYRSDYSVGVTLAATGAGGSSVWGGTTVGGAVEIAEVSYIRGLLGMAVNSGTLNHANIYMAGVHGQTGGAGVYTAGALIAAGWFDWGIGVDTSAIGHTEIVLLTNNSGDSGADTNPDSAFHLVGQYVDYWTYFDNCKQGDMVEDTENVAATSAGQIKISVDGTERYIYYY